MDYDKLIERLRTESLYADKASLEIMDLCMEAATALSTLQAENEKLRAEVESLKKGHCAGCSIPAVKAEQIRDLTDAPKLRAELEQIKLEKAVALEHLHGICSACKNYSPYHNRGKCRYCAYEPARDKDAEANDNWEWSGQKKEG